MAYIIAAVFGVIGVIVILVGISKSKLRAKVAGTSTSNIANLVQGQYAEIKGVVTCDQPLKTPDEAVPCVFYSYKLECHKQGSGSSSGHWSTVESRQDQVPFTLTDSTGTVTVDPEGADFDAPVVNEQRVLPEGLSRLSVSLGRDISINLGSRPYRMKTSAVKLDQELYVLGHADRDDAGQLRIVKGADKFFISTKSEKDLLRGLGLASKLYWLLGAALLVTGIVILIVKLDLF